MAKTCFGVNFDVQRVCVICFELKLKSLFIEKDFILTKQFFLVTLYVLIKAVFERC